MDKKLFVDEVIAKLQNRMDAEQIAVIMAALTETIGNYDVTKKVIRAKHSRFDEFDKFIERMQYRNRSQGTIDQYKLVIEPFLIAVNKNVPDITDGDIIEWLNQYEAEHHISKRTKDSKRKILSSFFSFLMANGYLPNGNPMSRVDPIDYTKTVREALTPREVEKMRIACGSDIRRNAIFEMFLATGCRVSELVNMKIEDIDFDEETVKVTGKGDKQRIVFLGARALEFLTLYLDGRLEGPVFVSMRLPHQGLKKSMLERIVRELAVDAGIDRNVFPHLLRHTFATHALNKGMPISGLCDLLGHSSVETTRIYAKNSYGKLKRDYEMYAS